VVALFPADGPRLFASLDPFLPPVPGQTLAGRGVANHQFLLALMRLGSFEGYHFFLSSPEELREFRSTYGAVAPGGAPISSLPRRSLIDRVSEVTYTAFHLADHVRWYQGLCCLRNERANHPFPVTALIHGISDPAVMQAYLPMGLEGPRPYDGIICSSPSGREVLRSCFTSLVSSTQHRIQPPLQYPMKLPVIPLGVDCASLEGGDRVRGRAVVGIPIDKTVLLYVGRFSAHDKMDLFPMFQAFARVRAETGRDDLSLLLAGSRQGTPYVDMLRMWAVALGISDDVTFISDFEEESKADLYAAADIFVSPCDNPQETFGLTVVEAMAAGLPVVVSDFDGYRETVPDRVGARIPTYGVGFGSEVSDLAPLVDRRSTHLRLGQGVAVDLRELTTTLTRLVKDPARREELGQIGQRHARKNYDWSVIIPQYEVLWDELSAEAAAYRPPEAPRPNPVRFDFGAAFRDYPTRLLREDEQLTRTRVGQSFLESGRYPVYAEMAPLLDLAHAKAVVDAAHPSVTVKDLVDRLGGAGVQVDRARRTILWALKHGLIERV